MHLVLSRGVDPRLKFLDDANATHSSLFEHTPTPVPCRTYATSSFAKLRAIEYLSPTKLNYSSIAFVSLQILIAFAPNPTYMFCSKRYTRSVSISIETNAKSKIRIHSAHPGSRNKDSRDVFSDLTLHYSVLPVRRTGHGS